MNYTGIAQFVHEFERIRVHDEALSEESSTEAGKVDTHSMSSISETHHLKSVLQRLVHKKCYICHKAHKQCHWFYSALCFSCGEFNYQMREAKADMKGMVAVVTGARIKIGFNTALKLLRNGATVIATTRFVNDAAERYTKEQDFEEWKGRLEIHKLDLSNNAQIATFSSSLAISYGRIDILINNAAQTIYRPAWTYVNLVEKEANSPVLIRWDPAEMPIQASKGPVTPQHGRCCEGVSDGFNDSRVVNSWRLPLEKVSMEEVTDVMTINSIAPFLLISSLLPLMNSREESEPQVGKFVVNVSSKEGQFYTKKSHFHPHTNMAKAALNMMTRTSAENLAARNVFLSSVDPGWVSHESPLAIADWLDQNGCSPPLDCVDAAARICYPIMQWMNAKRAIYGSLLVNYNEADW